MTPTDTEACQKNEIRFCFGRAAVGGAKTDTAKRRGGGGELTKRMIDCSFDQPIDDRARASVSPIERVKAVPGSVPARR